MTDLDQVIRAAYASEGKQEDVNKVYLTLLRAVLWLPVNKDHEPTEEEPFQPLFAKMGEDYFMVAFDTEERLLAWAGNEKENLNWVELSGHDVIGGMNEKAYLCLNMGCDFYKEFSPDEVKRLKTIVSKIDQLKHGEV